MLAEDALRYALGMRFTPASTGSLAAFVVILVGVVVAFLLATYVAYRPLLGPGGAARRTAIFGAALALWLGLLSAVVASGALAASPMPRVPILLVTCNLAAVLFALTSPGRRLAAGLPLAALVGFQGFRLPLELVLHSWAQGGTIPRSMTWEGANFDVVSGLICLLAAPLAARSRALAWTANLVGAALLLNVMRVALLSSPVPFGWPVEPPLLLAFHLPYALIAPVCVAGALAGHIILTRRLSTAPTTPPALRVT